MTGNLTKTTETTGPDSGREHGCEHDGDSMEVS